MTSTADYEARLIEARLAAGLGTLRLIEACHPDAADLVALVRSDFEAIREVLSWRADDLKRMTECLDGLVEDARLTAEAVAREGLTRL
jgi:hypothetical protein